MLDNPFVLLAVLASYQFSSTIYHLKISVCMCIYSGKLKIPPQVSHSYNVSDCVYIEGNLAKALLYNLHMTLFFVNEHFIEQTVI